MVDTFCLHGIAFSQRYMVSKSLQFVNIYLWYSHVLFQCVDTLALTNWAGSPFLSHHSPRTRMCLLALPTQCLSIFYIHLPSFFSSQLFFDNLFGPLSYSTIRFPVHNVANACTYSYIHTYPICYTNPSRFNTSRPVCFLGVAQQSNSPYERNHGY